MDKQYTILVVDDENGIRQSFKMVLKDKYNILLAGTGKEALEILTDNSIDLVLLDILLPDINGLELLEKLVEVDPNLEIIMVTAVNEVCSAVKAIKLGAYEYIIKPFNVDEIMILIERALEKRSLVKEVIYLRKTLEQYHTFEKMVGKDKEMRKIFSLISTIAEGDGTVLIQGESGTGKELVARAIHSRSPRKNHPFVVVNCAAIPVTLLESKIFGHNKGAFTGATRTNIGQLEIADKGTVFFDDIDSLEINMQAKLLRLIQDKEFERLGSAKLIKVDVRFVAASNKNLEDLVMKLRFREDLFYRLNVLPINLPPLKERKKDIPLLVNHFLEINAKKKGELSKKISKNALKALQKYDWPGNVRELENMIERLCTILPEPVIQLKDVSFLNIHKNGLDNLSLKEAVNLFEKDHIKRMLDRVNGQKGVAAKRLGIHRNTLLSKINN